MRNRTLNPAGQTNRKPLRGNRTWPAWLRALRLHFVLPSIIPAVLGSLVAGAHGHPLHLAHFALVVIGVTMNHLGLNLVDDVLDYRHAVDLKKGDEKNFFTGGSGVLTEGLIKDTQMLLLAGFFFVLTAIIGIYLSYTCGWPVLALGLFGMACSVFYTAPPVRFGYRGFGEAALLINFGPVIVLGAYFVQAGAFSVEPFMASLVPGFMMWSMVIINEIPDYEADRLGGKMNLVARFGRQAGVALYAAGLAAAYLILVFSALGGFLSPFAPLALASLPFAAKTFIVMHRHLDDPIAMAPANFAMIKVHLVAGTGLIIAYLIEICRH